MELNSDELALMLKLGLSTPKQKKVSDELPQYKIIQTVSKCKLCKTTTVQYFQLIKERGAWTTEKEIDKPKQLPSKTDTINIVVSICWACREVLLKRSKENLVQLLLDFHMFHETTTRKEVPRKKGRKSNG